MNLLIIIIITLFSLSSFCKQIKVAVMDSGITNSKDIPLCNGLSRNFGSGNFSDNIGHGTNVAHLIHNIAKKYDYCVIIIKVFPSSSNIKATTQAFEYLSTIDVDIINYSGGGPGYNKNEAKYVKTLLEQGKLLVFASGNNNSDLTYNCFFYPACYFDPIIVVGNGHKGKPYGQSNYGTPVDVWIDGRNKKAGGYTLTGSSQSTAIATGTLVTKFAKRKPSSEEQAIKKAAEALYKYNGYDVVVNGELKKIEEKTPDKVKNYAGSFLYILKILFDGKITHEWRF